MPTQSNHVTGSGESGFRGESDQFEGVTGISHAPSHGGVVGKNDNTSTNAGPGLYGESANGEGIRGIGHSNDHGAVVGTNGAAGPGLYGESVSGEGVRGVGHSKDHGGVVGSNDGGGPGVFGTSTIAAGVFGVSQNHEGVHGETTSTFFAAVAGYSLNLSGTSAGIYGEAKSAAGYAGYFKGNAHVTGVLSVDGDLTLTNADCAEEFDISDSAEPGMVMVLDEHGKLQASHCAYDTRVVGVVSGAGDYRPGIVLDRRPDALGRKSIALMGKVVCKVDAGYGAIAIGDLLTPSPRRGHAMRVADPARALGAVIGKALNRLGEGQGQIAILVALQ